MVFIPTKYIQNGVILFNINIIQTTTTRNPYKLLFGFISVAGVIGKGILLSAANSEDEVGNLDGTFVGVSSENHIFGLSYGVVYTSNIEGMGGIQIITDNQGRVLFRSKRYGTWTSPTRIDNFGYNTLEELAAALKPLMQ